MATQHPQNPLQMLNFIRSMTQQDASQAERKSRDAETQQYRQFIEQSRTNEEATRTAEVQARAQEQQMRMYTALMQSKQRALTTMDKEDQDTYNNQLHQYNAYAATLKGAIDPKAKG